jgi:integrase
VPRSEAGAGRTSTSTRAGSRCHAVTWRATARGDRPTKTRSARDISLDPVTLVQLEASWQDASTLAWQFRVSADDRRPGYIFTSDPLGGQPWRPDSANAWWAKARRSLDPPATCRMRNLRHFQATKLLDAGIPVPTVAARLGHADGTTTMKIYAHRTQRADEHAAEVVGRIRDG